MLQVQLGLVGSVTAESIGSGLAEIEQFEDIGVIECCSFHEQMIMIVKLFLGTSSDGMRINDLPGNIITIGMISMRCPIFS